MKHGYGRFDTIFHFTSITQHMQYAADSACVNTNKELLIKLFFSVNIAKC